jgi:hypothetical protein
MEHFNEFEQDPDYIADHQVIKAVLFDPKRAFRFIHKFQYENHLKPLLVLAGMANAFDRAASSNEGDTGSLGGIIFASLLIGGLLGWISYYVYSSLISWTGSWINGTASREAILRVLAYATIPTSLSLIVTLLGILIFQNSYFQENLNIDSDNYLLLGVYYLLTAVSIGLAVYTLILYVVGVAEVQGFSYLKALLNIALPLVLILVFALVLYLVFGLWK